MPNQNIETLIRSVGADGHVSADDVIFLRKSVFADGVVNRAELAALFALAEKAPQGDREWADYFAEAAADFFLREEEPHGYLTEEEFEHLEAFIARDGKKASRIELGLLVALMEKATSTPASMAEFTADQFRRLVRDRTKGAPRMDRADVELLRRYLYASAGDGSIAITKEEAELLFDLHELTYAADNDPSWADLFIKAVAAHLMAHVGYRPLPREEALRLHAWVKDQTVDPAGFFGRMVSGGVSGVLEAYRRKPTAAGKKNEDDVIAAAIAEQVSAQEADWLADRIGKNGKFDDIERALLEFMRGLGAELPPKLSALVAKAA
ncbi:MAG: hypothetical protein A3E78_12590 [Alphaproteobacteria bacterium RIFCSPHIGHO2_12_FULL_63_12]|nr:MAG: hypothetical protein A3E78_12590 [Alphaproteobacteria bacterium RIFCSPHIGHO2_12_FULL_63_12]